MRAVRLLWLLVAGVTACAPVQERPIEGFATPDAPSSRPQGARLNAVMSRVSRGAADLCVDEAADAPRADTARLCGYPVRIDRQKAVHASTNGRRIRVTDGLLRFVASDDELAFVLAHELSHNLLGHSGSLRGDRARASELEADRMGLLIAVRSGYDPGRAAGFLRRLDQAFPGLSTPHASYDALALRHRRLQGMFEEIAEAQAAGQAPALGAN